MVKREYLYSETSMIFYEKLPDHSRNPWYIAWKALHKNTKCECDARAPIVVEVFTGRSKVWLNDLSQRDPMSPYSFWCMCCRCRRSTIATCQIRDLLVINQKDLSIIQNQLDQLHGIRGSHSMSLAISQNLLTKKDLDENQSIISQSNDAENPIDANILFDKNFRSERSYGTKLVVCKLHNCRHRFRVKNDNWSTIDSDKRRGEIKSKNW